MAFFSKFRFFVKNSHPMMHAQFSAHSNMGMAPAISISTILEVFKRDKFECQFCGVAPYTRPITIFRKRQASPQHCSIDDLITGCTRCVNDPDYKEEVKNFAPLSDVYLMELPERHEQYSMMVKWQKENIGKHGYLCQDLLAHWDHLIKERKHTAEEYEQIYNLMLQFSYNTVEEAMNIASRQYLSQPATKLDLEDAFSKIAGIAYNITHPNEDRFKVNYIIKILKNRGIVENERQITHCKKLINENLNAQVSSDIIIQIAGQTKSYQDFVCAIDL